MIKKKLTRSGKPITVTTKVNSMNTDTIGELIYKVSKLHDIDDYIDFVNKYSGNIFTPITIFIMANIEIDKYRSLLKKIDVTYLSNAKYINYFEMLKIKAYDYIYETMAFLKLNNTPGLNEVLYNIDKEYGAFIMYLFVVLPNNLIKKFWLIVKDSHLTYEDHVSEKNLLMILVMSYYQNTDIDLANELLTVLKEYIAIVPKLLYRPKSLPILNKLFLLESKMDMSASYEEFKKTKYKGDINKNVLKLIEHIIKIDPKLINVTDSYGQNPLMYAAISNHIGLFDFIIAKGGNINTTIVSSTTKNTLQYIIKVGNPELQKHVIKYFDKINFGFVDHNLQTFAILAASTNNDLQPIFFKEIIKHSTNLENSDIFGNTILRYLVDNIEKFKSVKEELLNKKLDWSKYNIYNYQFINYAKEADYAFIYKLMIDYYKKYNNTDEKMRDIIYKMLESKTKQKTKANDVIIIKYKHADYSIFNNTWYNTLLQLFSLWYKYESFGFPFYNFDNTDLHKLIICTKIKCKKNEICTDKFSQNICNYYTDVTKKVEKYPAVYLQLNHLWYNKNSYIIPHKLYEGIEYVYKNTNQHIFGFMLSINEKSFNHANGLIVDMKKNIVIRFETYGNNKEDTVYSNSDLDNVYEAYFLSHNKTFKYIRPQDYLPAISFQSVSQTDNDDYIKMGDPGGFCAAWTVWFVETYIIHNKMINKKEDLKNLCENLFNKMLSTHGSIINYIRNYGNNLAEEEANIVHDKVGLHHARKYIKYYSNVDLKHIFNYINKEISSQFD